jgi:hypothetical protein
MRAMTFEIRGDQLNPAAAVALERIHRLEAVIEIYTCAIYGLIATHPDPKAFREEWRQLSAIAMGNSQIQPGNDPFLAARAEEATLTFRTMNDAVDRLAEDDDDED